MEAGVEQYDARPPLLLPPPPPRRRTPDHPPYAEMVRVALRGLAEESGSSEASISAYIRATYADLPSGHDNLLPYYLVKLTAAGEITRPSPCRYLLPPDNPKPQPRRAVSHAAVAPYVPRRRGRPPKYASRVLGRAVLHRAMTAQPSVTAIRRGRGRPRRGTHGGEVPPPRAQPALDAEPVPRPRLIIRLRTKPSMDAAVDGAGEATSCLGEGGCGGRDPMVPAVRRRRTASCRRPRMYSEPVSRAQPSKVEMPSLPPCPVPPERPETSKEPLPPLQAPPQPRAEEQSPLRTAVQPERSAELLVLTQVQTGIDQEEVSPPAQAVVPVRAEKQGIYSRSKRSQAKKRRRLWFEG